MFGRVTGMYKLRILLRSGRLLADQLARILELVLLYFLLVDLDIMLRMRPGKIFSPDLVGSGLAPDDLIGVLEVLACVD